MEKLPICFDQDTARAASFSYYLFKYKRSAPRKVENTGICITIACALITRTKRRTGSGLWTGLDLVPNHISAGCVRTACPQGVPMSHNRDLRHREREGATYIPQTWATRQASYADSAVKRCRAR